MRQRKKKRGERIRQAETERGEERNRQTAALERGHSEEVCGHHSAPTDRAGGEGRSGSLRKELPLQSVSLYIPLQWPQSGCSRRERKAL